jgi:hypothetical protein
VFGDLLFKSSKRGTTGFKASSTERGRGGEGEAKRGIIVLRC